MNLRLLCRNRGHVVGNFLSPLGKGERIKVRGFVQMVPRLRHFKNSTSAERLMRMGARQMVALQFPLPFGNRGEDQGEGFYSKVPRFRHFKNSTSAERLMR